MPESRELVRTIFPGRHGKLSTKANRSNPKDETSRNITLETIDVLEIYNVYPIQNIQPDQKQAGDYDMNEVSDYLRDNLPPESVTLTDKFFRNTMLPIVTAYEAADLYGFNAIDDKFVRNMRLSAADTIDRNVMINAWDAYFIQWFPDESRSVADRLSKQTMGRSVAILEKLSAQTAGILPSSYDTI